MASFGVEGCVYLALTGSFGALLFHFGLADGYYRTFIIVVTLLLRLVIYGQNSAEKRFITKVLHKVGVRTNLVKTAGISKNAAKVTGLCGGSVNQWE